LSFHIAEADLSGAPLIPPETAVSRASGARKLNIGESFFIFLEEEIGEF
jgi:hypothetical protein